MTSNTNEISTISIINSSLASLASQVEEVMKTRDQKIEELSNIIKEFDTDISKREVELIKKQEKISILKSKRELAEAELAELKGISNPFEKKVNPAPISIPASTPVVVSTKNECKNTLSVPTSFSGKVLPAYDGKNDLRVKHPDGRMCFIKEGKVEVGKEYLFDILNEGGYGTSYKVKAISEATSATETDEVKEVHTEPVEDAREICYTSGEEVKNTPFAKLLAGMNK